MSSLFGTLDDDIITAPTSPTLIVTLSGDDVVTIPLTSSNFNGVEDFLRIDGGIGTDRVEVELSGSVPFATLVGDSFFEVDPILYDGYTHRIVHTAYNELNDVYLVASQTLLRDIETITRFDDSEAALTDGSLTFHAETLTTKYNPTQASWLAGDERSVASRSDGSVVRVLSSGDSEIPWEDYSKTVVQIMDGDGAVTFQSAPFGIDYDYSGNLKRAQNYDPVVTVLSDDAFAVAWIEFTQTSSSVATRSEALKVQIFEADGSLRGTEQTIVSNRSIDAGNLGFTTIADDRLVVTTSLTGEIVTRVLDSDGVLLSSQSVDDFGSNAAGSVAYGDGFALIYEDDSVRDEYNRELNDLNMRIYAVDPDTAQISFVEAVELVDLEPDEAVSYSAYSVLGENALAAVIATTTGRILLSTYVDGTLNTRPVEMEYIRSSSNNQVSLVAAPGGGAWLAFQSLTSKDVEGVAFSVDGFAAFIDANGAQGPVVSVSDRVENRGDTAYNPIVAATDDGILALWENSNDLLGISYQFADSYNVIIGTAQNETLSGTEADDHIRGGQGDDLLQQNAGVDRFDGGDGLDTFALNPGTGAFASLEKGRTGQIDGTGTVEALLNIENLIGSDQADVLEDDAGANEIQGLSGDDTILGHGGADTLNGGAGTDTYRPVDSTFQEIRLPASSSIELLDLVNGDLDGTAGADLFDLSGITGYVTADTVDMGDGDDTFIGTQAADMVRGNSNNDRLEGRGGNDTLEGGSGTDTLIGGAGDDVMTGGNGFTDGNTFVIAPGDGQDIITDFQLGRDILNLTAFSDTQLDDMTVALNEEGDRLITFHDGGTLTLEGIARNHTPFGSIIVTGDAVEDGTLSVDFSGFTDYDTFDLDDIAYQWLRAGEVIEGATGATYLAGQADVNTRISVEIRYTDLFKSDEQRVSSQSQRIENINDAPTGGISLTAPVEGQTLTAVSTLADEDGLGTLSYQWVRGTADIIGETSDSYTMVLSDVGEELSVRVSYRDGGGTTETVTSESFLVAANLVNAAPMAVTLTGTITDIDENTDTTARLKVADITVTDDGRGTNDLTLSGDDAALFEIVGTELYLRAGATLESETNATLDVVVTVDDSTVGTTPDASVALSIAVNDVLGEPMDRVFQFALDGEQVTTPTGSAATGTGYGLFDVAAGTFTYSLSVTGLDFGTILPGFDAGVTSATGDDVTMAHIHTAASGSNGGIGFNLLTDDDLTATLNADGSWTISGVWDSSENIAPFTSAFASTMPGNEVDLYFNVHTTSFGAGEIRGQIVSSADSGANGVTGDGGNDTLIGLDGNDTLFGGAGNDRLEGGGGDDRLSGEDGNDVVLGGAGDDLIGGENGNDFVSGGAGNDGVYGGAGNDTLSGGAGNDLLNGGEGYDTADYSDATTDIVANINWGGAQFVSAEMGFDRYISIEALVGGAGNDLLVGNMAGNIIDGGDGDDEIYGLGDGDILRGGAGNDQIEGSGGNDRMSGGEGDADVLSYYNSAGGVTVDLRYQGVFQAVGGFSGTDWFDQFEDLYGSNRGGDLLIGSVDDNRILGFGGDDRIFGFDGNDELFGQQGNDLLAGGVGADVLTGGAGADVFDFNHISESTSSARDTVRDFSAAAGDIIDLSGIDANSAVAGNQAFTFVGSAAFGSAGDLRFVTNGTDGFVIGDVDGNGSIDLNILLLGVTSMGLGDFVL